LNIEVLMGSPGQLSGSSLAETTPLDGEAEGKFVLMLQALAAENGPPAKVETDASLALSLQALGQQSNPDETAPDSSGEALLSLTAVMTALQLLVKQNSADPTSESADQTENIEDAASISVNVDEENTIQASALLGLLSGSTQLSAIAPQQTKLTVSTEAETTVNIPNPQSIDTVAKLVGETRTGEAVITTDTTLDADGNFTSSSTHPGVNVSQVATVSANNSVATAEFDASLDANLHTNNEAATSEESADRNTNNLNIHVDTNQENTIRFESKSQIKPAVPVQQPAAPPTVRATASGHSTTFVEAKAALPDIPALHQIVDSARLITRQGETEVRLHLRPDSLGQLLIQLNVADGDLSVRILTETHQAQALVQDHLAQLKAAFAHQGLQLDGLSVAIGNDASSFDAQNRQSSQQFEAKADPRSRIVLDDVNQATASKTTRLLWNSSHAVDYQA
jgi:flagellar hook-length control protein FliK